VACVPVPQLPAHADQPVFRHSKQLAASGQGRESASGVPHSPMAATLPSLRKHEDERPCSPGPQDVEHDDQSP